MSFGMKKSYESVKITLLNLAIKFLVKKLLVKPKTRPRTMLGQKQKVLNLAKSHPNHHLKTTEVLQMLSNTRHTHNNKLNMSK